MLYIRQTSNESKKKHQLGEYQLIQYQIHQSNIIRIVWQAVKRITNKCQWMIEHFNWISRANPFFFLLHNAPWLVKKFPTTSSTNKTQSGKELSLDHMHFSALEHCLVTLSSHWLSEKFSFFPFNWLLCWVWFLVSICVCSETSWFVTIHIFDRLLHPLKMPWRAWL